MEPVRSDRFPREIGLIRSALGLWMSLPRALLIRTRPDVFAVAALVRRVALAHGGERTAAAAAAVAAAELASNIVRHGGGDGELTVAIEGDELTLRAADHGPGLARPEALFSGDARRSDHSRSGMGLGEGGPSILRLMDHVEARHNGASGLVVVCRKRLHARPRRSTW
jgi:anti-sigma regulatory factor (Ser/Thr protein kinase)